MKYQEQACLAVILLFASFASIAHPGHSDVVAVHGNGFGVWLMHQMYSMDFVLTFVVLAVLIALTGGRLFRTGGQYRRRRSRS
jgi:hypothetical protein